MKNQHMAIRKTVVNGLAALLFCIVASVVASNAAKAAALFEGTGIASDPYQIRNADDLMLLSECVNDKGIAFENMHFALTNDIDMSGVDFKPIGIFGSGHYFAGTLDGNGHAIKDISIDIPSGNNGLFGVLNGTAVNIEMDGGIISGQCCGIISSHAAGPEARVLNCLTRNVTVNAARSGGIVDNFEGGVVNCISQNCTLNGSDSYGGIAAYGISGDSFGNYYSFRTDDTGVAHETVVDGSSELQASDDWQGIVEQLNQNYRIHAVYPIIDYGICNEWAASDDSFDITDVKQSDIFQSNVSLLSGSGTFDDPYIISSADELRILRDAVNIGNAFYGEYFSQTTDLDLSDELWTPIGEFGSAKYFYGTYDGKGHKIDNLITIENGNNGLFGVLGGVVANLGIESGTIRGRCCGAITSHGADSNAMIVNCYNKAEVTSTARGGGVADNFPGAIIGCWSDCAIQSGRTGGIASYSAGTIKNCNTSFDVLVPEDTMEGVIVDSAVGAAFSGEAAKAMVDLLNSNIEIVRKASGLKAGLYPYTQSDGAIVFSDSPYSVDFWTWIHEHSVLAVSILLAALVYLCLLFQVGPKKLYRDDRKWWKRFLLVLAPVFLCCYMFLIHSPIEFFIVNASELGFVVGDFAYKYAILAIVLSVAISAVIALIKGVICDIVACAVMGLDLCMYAQLNFMNGSLGLLDGNKKAINVTGNYVNIAIWLLIFLLPFALLLVFKKHRAKVIMFACGALCVMQIAGIVGLLAQSPQSAFKRETSQYYLTSNDQFTVSADNNIILLVIDTYANTYLDEFFENYPEVEPVVKDFTYYNNADCHYEGSVFSINYITSGTEWDPSVTIDEWCKTAWDSERNNRFYSRLAEQGYIFNAFSNEINALSNDAKQDAVGKLSNMVRLECGFEVNDEIMFGLFTRASLYRFAPMLFKRDLEFTASDYSGAYKVISNSREDIDFHISGCSDNAEFYRDLLSKRLKTDESKNYYILYHLRGVHGPYVTNEKCETVEEATLLQTERGCWVYVEEYLNQLKELGVYDDATIIITADHGYHHGYEEAQPIFFLKSPRESHDHYVETNAPISFTDIMPTVLYLAGAKYDDIGTTVYDHTENEQRERTLFVRKYDEDLPDVPKRDSPTNSILNCFYKYVYTGDLNDLREIGEKGPTEKVPWTDAFY